MYVTTPSTVVKLPPTPAKRYPFATVKADHVNGLGRGNVTGQPHFQVVQGNNSPAQCPRRALMCCRFRPECTAKRKAQSVVKNDQRLSSIGADCAKPRHRENAVPSVFRAFQFSLVLECFVCDLVAE